MKIMELREKTDQELQRMLAEQRNKVRDLRFKVAARQLADIRDVREAKKAIARILTVMRSRRTA
jgi:large subunit ribosomal protein L29